MSAQIPEAFQLFVYGTLKPGGGAFKRFCEPYVTAIEPAVAPGRLYHLPLGYPAMTLEPGWVQGMRLTFSSLAVLDQLDEFEAHYPDRPEQSEYQRISHAIYRPDRRVAPPAWVYIMLPPQVTALGGKWLPDGNWSVGVTDLP
ncbi:MAG: gamma-glutamylcyclotransferase [Nodosilinea sp.]